MLYIINIITDKSGKTEYYRGYETNCESSMLLEPIKLKEILTSTKIQVVNARLVNGNIETTNWINELHTEKITAENYSTCKHSGSTGILIAVEKDKYKVVDYNGNIYKIKELRFIGTSEKIANCSIISNNNGINEILYTDAYKINRDEEFEKDIETKYNSYIAKNILLGKGDTTFDYEIENHEVKLKRYTGSNQNIIIPSFITAILAEAFKGKYIETISFNEGLKAIGKNALEYSGLDNVEIPESVEIVCNGAFGQNFRLFTGQDKSQLNTDRFKLRDSKTVVMNQVIYD